jgi:hypothetical protein
MAGNRPFSDGVDRRRVVQVVDGPLQGVGVVAEVAEDVAVARGAEKAADDTGFVAVVD